MKKLTYCISAFLLMGSLALSAQGKLDLGAKNFQRSHERAVRTGMAVKSLGTSDVAEESRTGVLITLTDDSAVDELTAVGIEVADVYGNIAVAYVTADDLAKMEKMEGVSRVQRTRRKRLLNNTARSVSSVDNVHQGVELPASYTGEGVIVGVVDGGFDPNHVMFKDNDGNMRVKKFWNYSVNMYTGRVTTNTYTGTQLASFTTDDKSATHATHVAGIAAGSYGFGSGGTQYYGMAPGCDILMAGGDLIDDVILAGAKAFVDYAAAEGKPLVINMSLGDNIGPHDGTDAFTTALNSIAKDNIICVASGNEADLDVAIVKQLTANDKTVKTTLLPNSDLLAENSRYQASCDVQVWASDDREFSVKIALVNRTNGEIGYSLEGTSSLQYVSCGNMYEQGDISNTVFNNAYSNSYAGIQKGLSAANNRYCAELTFSLVNRSSAKTYIPAIIVEGQPGQTIYVYNDAYYNTFSASGLSGYDKCTQDGTISNMACGEHTIAVGAYASKTSSWGSNGNVAGFSSWGTLADGRTLPHVCAPGMDITSAMSTPYYNSSYYSSLYDPLAYAVTMDGKKYTWTRMSGTSMATPVMTGVLALWAQARPEITPQEACEVAVATAKAPSTPSVQWGAGKLDAYEGIKKVLTLSSVDNVADREDAGLIVKALGDNCFEVFMPGSDAVAATLYSLSGTAVATANGNDTAILDARMLGKGIYLLKAVNGKNVATSKIVVR